MVGLTQGGETPGGTIPEEPPSGQMRIWWMNAQDPPQITISDVTGGAATALPFSGFPFSVGYYFPIPLGDRELEIETNGKVIKRVQVTSTKTSFHTLLLSSLEPKDIQILNDGDIAASEARLRVFNFTPGNPVAVSIGGGKGAEVKPNEMETFPVARTANLNVQVLVALPNGNVSENSGELNLSTTGGASYIVHQDAYGRMRPRYVLDAGWDD